MFILSILEDTLNDISSIWNRHRIRRYRQGTSRCGRPFLLHHMPRAFDTVDYGSEINENEVNICEQELETMQHSPCSKLIEDLCVCIMDENNVAMPQDPKSMRNLYIFLREDITNNLWLHSLCCACKIVYVDMINKLWFLCCSMDTSGNLSYIGYSCGWWFVTYRKTRL